jgi:hypothetical protein
MFVLSLIGIFAAREKLRGVLKFYAFSMTLVVGLLGVACASSFIFSWRINQIYSIRGDGKAGEVACRSQLYVRQERERERQEKLRGASAKGVGASASERHGLNEVNVKIGFGTQAKRSSRSATGRERSERQAGCGTQPTLAPRSAAGRDRSERQDQLRDANEASAKTSYVCSQRH